METSFDRFYIEESDQTLYQQLVEDEDFPIKTMVEIFLLSLCIGYQFNLRESIEKPHPLAMKASFLNIPNAGIIYEAFRYVAINRHEIEKDGLINIKKIIEEHAKGGFGKLYNEILNTPDSKANSFTNFIMLYM